MLFVKTFVVRNALFFFYDLIITLTNTVRRLFTNLHSLKNFNVIFKFEFLEIKIFRDFRNRFKILSNLKFSVTLTFRVG